MFTGSSQCRVRAGLVSFLKEVCDAHCGRADKRGEVCQAGTAPVLSDASVAKTSHCLCHTAQILRGSAHCLFFQFLKELYPCFLNILFSFIKLRFLIRHQRPNLVLKVSISLYSHLI